ncbi:MAG: hypothetical protein H2056_03420 [Sphingopyxis sp.]|nr:hypothetical protein [Sphingopyxis sp.]
MQKYRSEEDQTAPLPFSKAIAAAAKARAPAMAAADGRAVANALAEKLSIAADQEFASALSSNPRLQGYGVKVSVSAFRKAPPGLYKEPAAIVMGWLELPDRLLTRPNTEVVRSLQEKYPTFRIRKDFMNRRLHKWQTRHLSSLLAKRGISTNPADLLTLSSIKARIVRHFNPPEYDDYKLSIRISKDGSHVMWNGKRFSVFRNGEVPSIKRHGRTIALSTILRVVGHR